MASNETVEVRLKAALAGRYDIEREIGSGGMATVYLANDLRHERKVALKVLKPELAAVVGADRFLAEIKTTANLQHPNILPLFDSGEADSFLFFVMPFVEGETLQGRIDREKQLPIDEAVRIASDIAEALDHAHRQGIVHRDIKPANILLRDGRPLVTDFGIALAVSAAGGGRLTETGLSLGTPYYMSPEQATADRDPDARSDVYSLGCVLFEMLTGDPPFQGNTAQAVLSKILTEDAPLPTARRRAIPANVESATLKAIEKLPADRFSSAYAFAEALSNPSFRHGIRRGSEATAGPAPGMQPWTVRLGWGVAAVLAGTIGWMLLGGSWGQGEPGESRRYQILLPDTLPLTFHGPVPVGVWQSSLALSPDGKLLTWVASHGDTTHLVLRDLASGVETSLAGTEGAYSPFFSPDGFWIGFFEGGELKKIQVAGGSPVPLGSFTNPTGGAWTEDDRILVANREGADPVLISAAGGQEESLAGDELIRVVAPDLLPGDRWALGSIFQTGQLSLLSLETGEVLVLSSHGPVPTDSLDSSEMLVGSDPQYISSGHILYLTRGDGVMMALPFDGETLDVLGDPVPVFKNVRKEEIHGFGHFAVSEDGTIVYAEGVNAHRGYLGLVDGTGSVDTLSSFPKGQYDFLALSPDGTRLLTSSRPEEGGPNATSIHYLDRGQTQPLEIDDALSISPWCWIDDDRFIFLRSDPITQELIGFSEYSLSDGSALSLVDGSYSWPALLPDEENLVVTQIPGGALRVLSLEGNSVVQDLPATGHQNVVSPDGRWHAFSEDDQILVAPIPYEGLPHQVRDGASEQPRWSPDGEYLFFKSFREFWKVPVQAEEEFSFGQPELFARGPFVRVWAWTYAVTRDNRILTVLGPPERSTDHLEVVTNFFEELREKTGR